METLKSDVMRRIHELEDYSPQQPVMTVYPGAKTEAKQINGYPVFQFSYEGTLPLYQQDGKYRSAVRYYYFRATFEAYDRNASDLTFSRAAVLIIHYFKDRFVRDLDNRNRKFLLDAIRQTGLIQDDSWRDLAVMEEGYHDPHKDHVQAYVLAREHLADFLTYMERYHSQEIMVPHLSKHAILEEAEGQQFQTQEEKMTGEIEEKNTKEAAEYQNMWN
ncbi:RusA family crossover junction endodeoxyribonuclease [Domibacillus indicus]|uniref:hypothetical protein n=1 Tax=Domibacillus indicus TaxID=1437523 RepID=UPI0006183192|nr:hypothetical protein [Domibacillus indicus]